MMNGSEAACCNANHMANEVKCPICGRFSYFDEHDDWEYFSNDHWGPEGYVRCPYCGAFMKLRVEMRIERIAVEGVVL